MIKLFCPNCMKSVSFPDDSAGKDSPCPECGKPFPVPARYNAIVAAMPPPVIPPPLLPEPVPSPTGQSTMPLPAGYTHSRGFTLSPCVVAWIPSIALTAILLLTLAPWVGVYPGGHAVYAQGAWRSITGWPKRSIQLEELLLKELPPPSVYDRTSSDWIIMLPYVLALILAFAGAWAERLENAHISTRLPRMVPTLWPYRHALIAGFAGAALLLLAVETARGFGLERAMHAAVADKFDAPRKAAGTSPGEQEKIDFYEVQELTKYDLERTGWLYLVFGMHVLAVLAMLVRGGLERRGNKPPPRFVVQY